MKVSEQVIETIKDTIQRHNLIKDGDFVLVGVSGGADSVCLLHALLSLKKSINFEVEAAHVNHMLRGADADSDEEYVLSLCKKLKVKASSVRIDVDALAKDKKMTLEEAGRLARYEFFTELCSGKKNYKIATAHNKNDQAETLLMRIMRGTGTSGLRGIKYLRRDNVIRPLLDVERKDIEAYCDENNLEFRTDITNTENTQTRSRIRNVLIPMLEEQFNPNIVSTLARLTNNVADDADFLDNYANRLYKRLNSPLPDHKPTVLHIESLNMIGFSIQARLVLIAAREAMGRSDYNLERRHIIDILSLCDADTGDSLDLPEGLRVSVEYGWLYFVNTVTDISNGNADFTVKVFPGNSYDLPNGYRLKLEVKDSGYEHKANEMRLNYDIIDDEALSVRFRRRGDRFVYDMDGKSKKVSRYLIDQKVSRRERDSIPLLCHDGKVAAILGIRVATPFYINKNTGKILVVTYERC